MNHFLPCHPHTDALGLCQPGLPSGLWNAFCSLASVYPVQPRGRPSRSAPRDTRSTAKSPLASPRPWPRSHPGGQRQALEPVAGTQSLGDPVPGRGQPCYWSFSRFGFVPHPRARHIQYTLAARTSGPDSKETQVFTRYLESGGTVRGGAVGGLEVRSRGGTLTSWGTVRVRRRQQSWHDRKDGSQLGERAAQAPRRQKLTTGLQGIRKHQKKAGDLKIKRPLFHQNVRSLLGWRTPNDIQRKALGIKAHWGRGAVPQAPDRLLQEGGKDCVLTKPAEKWRLLGLLRIAVTHQRRPVNDVTKPQERLIHTCAAAMTLKQ